MPSETTPLPGILLVNLGTPDAPTAAAVRRYLGEFLADPRVVEIPRPLWLTILYLFILPRRSPRVAKNYQAIWTERGSPLRFHTEDQARALGELTGVPTVAAFRYGHPSLQVGLQKLREQGATKIIVLPMYPQNSATTTATIFDKIAEIQRPLRELPDFSFISSYPTHPLYIEALAQSIRTYWAEQGRGDMLLMSFHGLPARNVELGDPYKAQCEQTAAALAEALKLAPGDWVQTYQSRFGPAQWLQPYTEPTLEKLAGDGVKKIDVVCPGFLADCLETLEEIAIGANKTFRHAGGDELRYIPALNANSDLTKLFAALAGCEPRSQNDNV